MSMSAKPSLTPNGIPSCPVWAVADGGPGGVTAGAVWCELDELDTTPDVGGISDTLVLRVLGATGVVVLGCVTLVIVLLGTVTLVVVGALDELLLVFPGAVVVSHPVAAAIEMSGRWTETDPSGL
jgi:hypothetical protein